MQNNQKEIAGAIIIAGFIIAGAVLLKGNLGSVNPVQAPLDNITLAPVSLTDRTIGNQNAKLTMILYEDFQCPFCERFFNDTEKNIRSEYVPNGNVQLVYRDFAFLGKESLRAAEAARCAADQGKFWEYHDYLYTHQNGENQGAFSDANLKTFAKNVSLNTAAFNECLTTSKYANDVASAKTEAGKAGVSGTPKAFLIAKKDISAKTQAEILKALNVQPNDPRSPVSFYKTKNIVSINGALPFTMVKTVIDILLK